MSCLCSCYQRGGLVTASSQVRPFGVVGDQLERAVVGDHGLAGATEPDQQLRARRMQQVVRVERL